MSEKELRRYLEQKRTQRHDAKCIISNPSIESWQLYPLMPLSGDPGRDPFYTEKGAIILPMQTAAMLTADNTTILLVHDYERSRGNRFPIISVSVGGKIQCEEVASRRAYSMEGGTAVMFTQGRDSAQLGDFRVLYSHVRNPRNVLRMPNHQ